MKADVKIIFYFYFSENKSKVITMIGKNRKCYEIFDSTITENLLTKIENQLKNKK